MIDIFGALSWLTAIDNCSYLNNEVRRLIKDACIFSQDDSTVKLVLERLRNAGRSLSDPLEKAEILLHCAAIGYWRGWLPGAACDAQEAVISYDSDDHRRAVALWMLGMTQWKMFQNHNAHKNWIEAKKIFKQRQILFQHFPDEKNWYENAMRNMDVELAARPEEIATWLNYFERSSLKPPTQQVVKSVQEKIRQEVYPNVYVLMQDLQEANRRSEEVYEKAEIYLEFGLAVYQMRNTHFAVELLRKAVEKFSPGIGNYHKQVIARCMLGAVEWMQESSHSQATVDWRRCIEGFENLRWWAEADNLHEKREWYAKHHAILQIALLERSGGITTERKQNPESSERLEPNGNIPEEDVLEPYPPAPNEEISDPYQDLLSKVRGEKAIADRLIEFERRKAPNADQDELIKRAIERWERDNK